MRRLARTVAPARVAAGRRTLGETFRAFVYVLPALVLFAVFLGYPIVQTVLYSRYEWDGISSERESIGLDNYRELFGEDPYFWKALRNTLVWGFSAVAVSIVAGLLLASLLDHKFRGRAVFRSVFFVPAVMSPVVIAAVWTRIYNPQAGFANQVLGYVGIDGQVWLGEEHLALASTMVVAVWRWTGLFMLFYLAGLQTVPSEILEAAKIDGAGYWNTLWRVLVPMLKPTTALLILLGTISAMREFEVMQILTGGGPAHATDLLSIRIFDEAFELFNAGYGAAISVVLLVLTASLAIMELRYMARVNGRDR